MITNITQIIDLPDICLSKTIRYVKERDVFVGTIHAEGVYDALISIESTVFGDVDRELNFVISKNFNYNIGEWKGQLFYNIKK